MIRSIYLKNKKGASLVGLMRHGFANLRKGTPWTTHSGLTAHI